MLINKFRIYKKIDVSRKELRLIVIAKKEKLEFVFSGIDVFSGDYWNSIFIGNELYDINFYKYPKNKLTLYKVENSIVDYSNFHSI